MTGIPIKRGKFGQRYTGKTPHDNGGKDWSDVSTSQGLQTTTQSDQEARKDPSHQSLQTEHNPVSTSISDF